MCFRGILFEAVHASPHVSLAEARLKSYVASHSVQHQHNGTELWMCEVTLRIDFPEYDADCLGL